MSEKPIDIGKVVASKSAERKSRPFLWTNRKLPVGNKFIAFRVKFIEEIRQFTSKAKKVYDCIDALVLQVDGDPDTKKGEEYTVILPTVLRNQIREHAPLTGKICEFANKGMPKDKSYFDFGVLFVEGELAAETLAEHIEQLVA